MKKILTVIISAAVLSALFLTIPVTKGYFSDITAETDYKTAINWMYKNSVIKGYPDATFKPNQCVKRVEFLKMLFLMLDIEVTNADASLFSDTKAGEWYENYVKTARARGTVKGYPDGTFHPAQCVNRVEALKMAILEFNNNELPQALSNQDLPQDVYQDAWYYNYFLYANEANIFGRAHIINSNGGYKYFPGEPLTRKEAAELLYRLKTLKDYGKTVYAAKLSEPKAVCEGAECLEIDEEEPPRVSDCPGDCVRSETECYGEGKTILHNDACLEEGYPVCCLIDETPDEPIAEETECPGSCVASETDCPAQRILHEDTECTNGTPVCCTNPDWEPVHEASCTETDGEFTNPETDYDHQGTVSGYNRDGTAFSHTDLCNLNTLTEYFCVDADLPPLPVWEEVNADCSANPNEICLNGACVCKPELDADSDGICNENDLCAGTPTGQIVDFSGCTR